MFYFLFLNSYCFNKMARQGCIYNSKNSPRYKSMARQGCIYNSKNSPRYKGRTRPFNDNNDIVR